MTDERFDDEILSAIIDGEADAEVVASVNADPEAVARLSAMRQGVSLVSAAVPDATAERRSASIAAALAAATPAPEVSSLAAARHAREAAPKKRRQIQPVWIAVAAAVLAFVVAVPFLSQLGSGSADFATNSSDDSVSLGADEATDAAEDVVDDSGDDSADDAADAGDAGAMETDGAMDDTDAAEDTDDAMEDDGAAAGDDVAPTTTVAPPSDARNAVAEIPDGFTIDDFLVVNNIEVLDSLIDIGSVQPQFSAGDAIIAGVNPNCVKPTPTVSGDTPYALAVLTPFAGDERLIFVEFADDETTRVLEAEDCASLR